MPVSENPEGGNPQEQRLVLRLLARWRELCGDKDWPTLADINAADLADMKDFSFVVDLSGGRPRFSHYGRWHAEFGGADMTGKAIDQLPRDTLAERAVRFLPEVLARKIPITYGGDATEPNGRKLFYRSILLPLSEDGQIVNAVLGAANCKIVGE